MCLGAVHKVIAGLVGVLTYDIEMRRLFAWKSTPLIEHLWIDDGLGKYTRFWSCHQLVNVVEYYAIIVFIAPVLSSISQKQCITTMKNGAKKGTTISNRLPQILCNHFTNNRNVYLWSILLETPLDHRTNHVLNPGSMYHLILKMVAYKKQIYLGGF